MVVTVREKELEAVATLDEANIEQPEESQEIDLARLYTVAEYMALPDGDDGKAYELVEGKLVEMQKGGPSGEHGGIASMVDFLITAYTIEKKLGKSFTDTAFLIDPVNKPNTARRPDVAYVTIKRLTSVAFRSGAIPLAPDIAVEVVSRSDIWFEVLDKVAEYQDAKVPLVWVIVPPSHQIFVYRLGQKVQMFLDGDELDGYDVIPGFKLKANSLFDWVDWTEQAAIEAK